MFDMKVIYPSGINIITTNVVDGGNILSCPELTLSFLDKSENVIEDAKLCDYLQEAVLDYIYPPRAEVNYDITMPDKVWKLFKVFMCDDGITVFFLDTEHPEFDPDCKSIENEDLEGRFFRYFEETDLPFSIKVSGYSLENRYIIYERDYRLYSEYRNQHHRACVHIHITEYNDNVMIREYESYRPRWDSVFLRSCLKEKSY